MKRYVGHPLQTRGAQQFIMQGGKADGMHFLQIRNGLGLEVWLSLDRAGDASSVTFKGTNMGYFSPCGYVAPQYYDCNGTGFLKSFTAGFFTTCGLTAVGSPCTDDGEVLPLHGTVSNIPATLCGIDETSEGLTVTLLVRDAVIFGRKLIMKRKYFLSYSENRFSVEDTVTNEADTESPYMIMYHCNMGYPLLNENSIVSIPHASVTPRDGEAAKYIESALKMEKPQAGFAERCYYYDVNEKNGIANAGIYSPDADCGVVLSYDKKALPCFTEWKMMGKTDYVLGLEPGNCTPDGRDILRRNGTLKFLQPDESATTAVTFTFFNDLKKFQGAI